ncbi:MAG: hypothetical protein NT090_14010, partial [Acidobacteria bacterium]|nr:hypothetical protein [Acidobacteriota bacterium]
MRWIPILLLSHALVAAPGLRQRIDKILDASPAARRAHWGIHVVVGCQDFKIERNYMRLSTPYGDAQ